MFGRHVGVAKSLGLLFGPIEDGVQFPTHGSGVDYAPTVRTSSQNDLSALFTAPG